MVIYIFKTLLLSIIKAALTIRIDLDDFKIVRCYTCEIKLTLNQK